MSVVAGVDSSTQSTKVILRDGADGRVLGAGRGAHPPTSPPASEQDPESWWSALRAALREAAADAGIEVSDIDAISIAAQCHGLVALDAQGAVIRPAKLWNDTESAAQMEALLDALPPTEWARRIGTVPTAAFTISKVAWLREREPENFARLAAILLPHDWLTYRLTGELVTDRSEASGTGYFDAVAMSYDHELLDLVGVGGDVTLPRVLAPAERAGAVTSWAAEQLGLREGTIVGPGAGDQHASALGLGIAAGDVVFALGTSGVVFTVSATRPADATGTVDGVADADGGYLPLVSTLNAAKVTDTVARLLGVDHEELSRLAMNARRCAQRPVFAAFLDGERSPDRPLASGILSGITSSTTREDLALAAYEGVIFGLVRGQRALAEAGIAVDGDVVAIGGGAASEAYLAVLADTIGRAVHTVDVGEAVALGAAVQAAACLNRTTIASVRASWAPGRTIAAEPSDAFDPTVFERYLSLANWTGADRA